MAAVALGLVGIAGLKVKNAFEERTERKADLAAYEAVQAARIERGRISEESVSLRNKSIVLPPGTKVRSSPALLEKGGLWKLDWIDDNVYHEIEEGKVWYIPEPMVEKDNGSGLASAVTWYEFTDHAFRKDENGD